MLSVGMYLADRYEIVSKVGAGGMSDVYRASDHSLGRDVAIKVLKEKNIERKKQNISKYHLTEFYSTLKNLDIDIKKVFPNSNLLDMAECSTT